MLLCLRLRRKSKDNFAIDAAGTAADNGRWLQPINELAHAQLIDSSTSTAQLIDQLNLFVFANVQIS